MYYHITFPFCLKTKSLGRGASCQRFLTNQLRGVRKRRGEISALTSACASDVRGSASHPDSTAGQQRLALHTPQDRWGLPFASVTKQHTTAASRGWSASSLFLSPPPPPPPPLHNPQPLKGTADAEIRAHFLLRTESYRGFRLWSLNRLDQNVALHTLIWVLPCVIFWFFVLFLFLFMLCSSLFGCIFSSEDDHIYKVGKFVTVGYGGGGGGGGGREKELPPPPPFFFFLSFFGRYITYISCTFCGCTKMEKIDSYIKSEK